MAGDGISASQKVLAIMIGSGILATVAAMGLRAGDNAAEARRTSPEAKEARKAELEALVNK